MSIIYPPNEHKTSSKTIFFIGHASKSCFINNREIDLVYAGNFCPVFELELGENHFEVELDAKKLSWTVMREEVTFDSKPHEFKEFKLDLADPRIKKICLDPGHGGEALGTCSPKGILEKDINLSLALILKAKLEAKGFEIMLTRTQDEDLSLEKRVNISKDFNSDLFISLHHNAIEDYLNPLEHKGLSVHYYYEDSKALSERLALDLSKNLRLRNNGAIQQNLYVTRENFHCRAVLIEAGFLIHPEESEKIITEEFQEDFSTELAEFLFCYNKTGF